MPDTSPAAPGPPTQLPATIPEVLEQARNRFGAAEALVDPTVRLGFVDLADAADEAARAFIAARRRARRPGGHLGPQHA